MTSPSSPTSAAQPTDHTRPVGQATQGRRSVGIMIVVMMALCLLFVGGYVQRLAQKAAVEAQIAVVEQQIEQAKVRTAILGKELAQVNDDAHVAAIARDALNLVQEGDQLIAVVDVPAAEEPAASAAASVRAPVNSDPNWRRWLDLLFPLN